MRIIRRIAGALLLLAALISGCLAALYALWPSLVSRLAARELAGQGFDHIVMDVERPGWTGFDIPLLTFQTTMGGERLTVTIEGAHVGYDVAGLQAGRIERVELPHVSVHVAPVGDGALEGDGLTSAPSPAANLEVLLRPLPLLPIREVALGRVAVRREGVGGAIHEGTVGGELRLDGRRLRASLELQEAGGRSYRLDIDGADFGDAAVTMESLAPVHRPVLAVRSQIQPEASAMQLSGTLQADVHELAPLLALVMPIEGDLQRAEGRLWMEWSGTASKTAAVEVLPWDEATHVAGTFHADVRLPQWGDLATTVDLKADGTLLGNGRRLAWTLASGARVRARVVPTRFWLSEWTTAAEEGMVPVTLETSGVVEGETEFVARPVVARVKGPLVLRLGEALAPSQLDLSIAAAAWGGGSRVTAEATVHARGRAARAARALLRAGDVRWDVAAVVSVDPARLEVEIRPDSTVMLSKFALDRFQAATAVWTVRRPLRWSGLHAGGGTLVGGELRLQLPIASVGETDLSVEAAALTIHRFEWRPVVWSGDATMRIAGVLPKPVGVTLPKTDWTVRAHAESSRMIIEFEGAAQDGHIAVKGTGTHQLEHGAGHGRIELAPVRFDATAKQLSDLVKPWAYPFDATGGAVSATAEATWGPPTRASGETAVTAGSFTVRLDGLTGHIKGYPFTGLTTKATVHVTRPGRPSMPEPAEVSIALVRTGVDLKSLTARVRLGWNDGLVPEWVEVRNVAMSLFGGLVTSEGARYERSRAVSTPSVVLQGLKVQEILNLEQQKGLEGTGELDGVLPMTVSGGEVTIQNGVIEARPPGGVIRYRPSPESTEALAASNSQMNLVLQPLSNFHYNTLSARVQYAGDGTLKLETKLEGRNPDWQKGRPVHFNLNIEENIPALIKTLGIVQGIQESIENRFDSRDDR